MRAATWWPRCSSASGSFRSATSSIGPVSFPRVLGVALMVGAFGYLASFVLTAASPRLEISDAAMFFAIPAGLAEGAFLLWLVIMGVSVPRSDAHGAVVRGRSSEGGPA